MPLPRAEFARRAARWIVPVTLAALAPKCLACLAAYAGLGAALGASLGGPELCGAAVDAPIGAMVWLAAIGAAAGLVAWRRWAHPHAGAPAPAASPRGR